MLLASGFQPAVLECCAANRLHQTSEKILKFERVFSEIEGEHAICVLLKIFVFKTQE